MCGNIGEKRDLTYVFTEPGAALCTDSVRPWPEVLREGPALEQGWLSVPPRSRPAPSDGTTQPSHGPMWHTGNSRGPYEAPGPGLAPRY